MSVLPVAEINAFFDEMFEDARASTVRVTAVGDGAATITMITDETHIRPGGFVSGPTQMGLADHAAYVAIFTKIGITPMALTSNLNIDFLRPAIGPNLRAEAEVVKLGRTLAVIAVDIYAGEMAKPCSRSTVTYALPK